MRKRRDVNPLFADFPCGSSCTEDCSIRIKMMELQRSLVPVQVDGAAEVVRAFFASYRQLCLTSTNDMSGMTVDIALPALFDLLMSAKYAETMASDDGWTYCEGAKSSERPAIYFPYLKTCPRCSVNLGLRPKAKANKPGSDKIGSIASDVNTLILGEAIRYIAPNAKIAKSDNRRGDIDIVIYTNDILALAEVKSSPLVVYPLEILLDKPLTEVREGESVPKEDHSNASPIIDTAQMALYIPHRNVRIPLGPHATTNWPYSALVDFVKVPANTSSIISAWHELYNVYATRTGRGTRDNRQWITCGCGGDVDDSKNAPGMDRTDDLKKGTYQVLKFGTYYKEKCPKRLIRAVLISNMLALHGFERYLAEVEDVLWTKAEFEVGEEESASVARRLMENANESQDAFETRTFRTEGIFSLFDALLCLTRSIYRDDRLRELTSLEQFAAELCNE